MREIIRASAWSGFRELVIELGGDPDAILAAAQVSPSALTDPERYMPLRAFVDSLASAAERLERPDFGLRLGQVQNISTLGALSIAIINAPTAREGIEVAARFMHVHNPALSVTLAPMPRTSRDFLSATLALRSQRRREQNDERIIASFHRSLSELGGDDYKPREVWFMHEPISSLTVYRKIFGITPSFGKPTMGIAIERAVLDTWRPGGSSHMREIAETYLHAHTPTREKVLTRRVTTMARSLLKGRECTPEQAAKALGLHARTLQRRLKGEGTSFEKIKDNVRREWAERLLKQPTVSISQIAQMLDYADGVDGPCVRRRSAIGWSLLKQPPQQEPST
ncbi:MAG TPA: AraC family transcriptional regulator ligand-binding domain-containing protein [Hyphomonadaceae bacterium]|nr:AraC family transcriptional regulator ligand-binding domain-containing protein [Hyphomonadaceae bacterium]